MRSTRRDHPNHIYTIWLGFSFTLCFVGAWNFATYLSAVYTRGPLFGKTIDNIVLPWLRSLTEVSVEIAILLFIFWIFVVPQVISYFLSGVFGCASRPVFVSKITTVVVWLVIKAFAACAGALAATSIFALYGDPDVSVSHKGESPRFFIGALFAISMSFVIMMVYYKSESVLQSIINHRRLGFAAAVHDFLTKYTKETNLGEREGGTAHLTEAVAAFRAALEVFVPAGADYYINMGRNNRNRAQALLAERDNH